MALRKRYLTPSELMECLRRQMEKYDERFEEWHRDWARRRVEKADA